MCVDVAGVVADLREGETVSGDEVIKRAAVACPCDSDELDFAVPLLVGRFDRSGFLVAGASSRRPEPQHGWPPGERGPVELATVRECGGELQDVGSRAVRCTGGVVSACGDAE